MPSNPNPQAPKMPTIPTPTPKDMDAHYHTLISLKMVSEMLMGTRGGQPVTRTYVQNDQPTAHNVGDQWIIQNTGKHMYWDGTHWLPTT